MLGSFVVLQGVPGDGLRNTIDRPLRRAIAVASAPDRVPVLTTATADDEKLIQDWHLECRRNEVCEHEEWLENNNFEGKEERWWITREHQRRGITTNLFYNHHFQVIKRFFFVLLPQTSFLTTL